MQRTDPAPWTMNAKEAKLVFMKIQIIQARSPAFGMQKKKFDTADFWSKNLNMADNFSYVFSFFSNSDPL